MAMNIKRRLVRKETYIPKEIVKHNHNYSIKHLLIVTNINKYATANNYLKKEYYYVLKCDQCNSFIPMVVDEINQSHIFDEKNIDRSLPVITANTMAKSPIYFFSELIDVKVNK